MRVKEGWPVRNTQHAIRNTQRGSKIRNMQNAEKYAQKNTLVAAYGVTYTDAPVCGGGYTCSSRAGPRAAGVVKGGMVRYW